MASPFYSPETQAHFAAIEQAIKPRPAMSPALQALTPERLGAEIVRAASRFVGLREVKPNASWDLPATPGRDDELTKQLRDLMRPTPWTEGWAYCAAFAEAAVRLALIRCGIPNEESRKFLSVHGPGVMNNVRAFQRLALLSSAMMQSPLVSIGALWLARHGETAQGHEGIVTGITSTAGTSATLSTIEANTSLDSTNAARDREGDWITTRIFTAGGRGTLRTQGFITPAAILCLLRSK